MRGHRNLLLPVWPTGSSARSCQTRSALMVYVTVTLIRVVFTSILVSGLSHSEVNGQEQTVIDVRKEYNVKGAFLYSFGRYTSWPDKCFTTDAEPFVVGVLGDAPISPILRRIEQTKQINKRRIEVRHLSTLEMSKTCHILFVSRSVPERDQRALIRSLAKSPVLIVGETDDFTISGGVIRFFVNDGSVRFEINVSAARKRMLSFDAKLLRIARVIEPDE